MQSMSLPAALVLIQPRQSPSSCTYLVCDDESKAFEELQAWCCSPRRGVPAVDAVGGVLNALVHVQLLVWDSEAGLYRIRDRHEIMKRIHGGAAVPPPAAGGGSSRGGAAAAAAAEPLPKVLLLMEQRMSLPPHIDACLFRIFVSFETQEQALQQGE